MKKIGLALSGGGVKSFSQLPILKALDSEGIEIDVLAGTSMGSVIAALMAVGMPIEELIDVVLELEKEVQEMKIFSRSFFKLISVVKDRKSSGFVDGIVFEELMNKYLKKYNVEKISDVKIPLAIPAVDIISGKVIVFVSHPEQFTSLDENWVVISDVSLAKAVRASCSFPFVIDACPLEDYHLTDGGVRMNLPLPLIEAYGAKQSIAVTMHSEDDFTDFDSFFSLANRITELGRIEQDQHLLNKADVVINVPLDGVWVFEVGKGKYTMDAGLKVMEGKIDELTVLKHEKTWIEKLFERSKK